MKKSSKYWTGVGNISTVCLSDAKRDREDLEDSLPDFYMKEQDIPEYLEGCGLTTCTAADMPEDVDVLQDKEQTKEKKLSSASIAGPDTKKTIILEKMTQV